MSAFNKERVSEWMDSESTDDAVIDQLRNDEALCNTWERYQIIGDSLRGDTPEQVELDIASRVSAALADEPTVLAPKPSRLKKFSSATVVNLFKQAGQYGIAASVAAAVLVGVQQYTGETPDAQPLPVLSTTPFAGVAQPVSLNAPTPEMMQASNQRQVVEQRRRISAYLQDHHEQLRVQPFAKIQNDAKVEPEVEEQK